MTKIFNKLKKPCSWHIFGPFSQFSRQKKIFFSRKSGSVCATSYGFLAPCQNLEKTNDTIPRKRPERRKEGRTEGRKDGKTQDPSDHRQGSNKRENTFKLFSAKLFRCKQIE